MGRIFVMIAICVFMAMTAKSAFILFVFLVHVPVVIGMEVYRYKESKRRTREYLNEKRTV